MGEDLGVAGALGVFEELAAGFGGGIEIEEFARAMGAIAWPAPASASSADGGRESIGWKEGRWGDGAGWVAVVVLVCGGCVSSKSGESAAERRARLLEGNDFGDVRMSSQPGDGLGLTGVWRVRVRRVWCIWRRRRIW